MHWLAWLAGIALGVLVVAGVIRYATGISSGEHHPTLSVTGSSNAVTAPRALRYGFMGLRIAYGSTPKQVLGQIGSPTKKQAHCWLYRGHVGNIRGRYPGPYVDAMKFCFSAGPTRGNVMTQIFSHYAAHTIATTDPITQKIGKTHFAALWGRPVTLMKVPDWYQQESF